MPTRTPESAAEASRLASGFGARRSYRLVGALPLLCATVTAGLALTGCAQEEYDDPSPAGEIADRQAALLNERLGHRDRVRDAEYIAATEVLKETQEGSAAVRLVPLAWSGRTAAGEQATIDVQIVVTLTEQPAVTYDERGNAVHKSTQCYRYLLELYRYTSYQEIDCPTVGPPPVPTAAPPPALPADARERLAATLRSATPDTLADAVRAAFPEEHVTVDTATHEGALVAAVGVPAERDCVLLVRTPSGEIESPGYDRVWLEPGEMGCKTGLFVSPPR